MGRESGEQIYHVSIKGLGVAWLECVYLFAIFFISSAVLAVHAVSGFRGCPLHQTLRGCYQALYAPCSAIIF
jgi:hypothetical protein